VPSGAHSSPKGHTFSVPLGNHQCSGCRSCVVSSLLFSPERILTFPTWFWPFHEPFWWPFRPQRFAWRPAPLAVALIAITMFVGVVAAHHKLRLRWTLIPPRRGESPAARSDHAIAWPGACRLSGAPRFSGHAEFVLGRVAPEIIDTLVNYEDHMPTMGCRPSLAPKGRRTSLSCSHIRRGAAARCTRFLNVP